MQLIATYIALPDEVEVNTMPYQQAHGGYPVATEVGTWIFYPTDAKADETGQWVAQNATLYEALADLPEGAWTLAP
jgi:hypothetical protein